MDVVLSLLEAALKLLPEVVIAAPIIALVIDLAKKYLNLPDGKAGLVSLILNAVFWGLMIAAGKLGVEVPFTEFLTRFAEFAPAVVALILALFGTKLFHKFAVQHGIGYSFRGARG